MNKSRKATLRFDAPTATPGVAVWDDATITAALVCAALAALLHVYIFTMESLTWTTPHTRATFGTTVDDAATNTRLAANQGFWTPGKERAKAPG